MNSCWAESVYVSHVLTVSDQTNNTAQHYAPTTADGCFHSDHVVGSSEAAVRRKSIRMHGASSEPEI